MTVQGTFIIHQPEAASSWAPRHSEALLGFDEFSTQKIIRVRRDLTYVYESKIFVLP